MQVSSNILRFPYATATVAAQRVENRAQDEEKIVAFAQTKSEADDDAQERGMLFAANRIAGRVADELERVADF